MTEKKVEAEAKVKSLEQIIDEKNAYIQQLEAMLARAGIKFE